MLVKPNFKEHRLTPPSDVHILFRSTMLPTGVTGLPGAAARSTSARYESSVTVSGGVSGNFRGTIYPDDMNVKGRIQNGIYNLYLGFHGPGTPVQDDLEVRINGFRAVLIVNAGRPIPVSSFSPAKTTSDGIHIHNGYHHWTSKKPMSEGCLLVAPGDWPAFISKFINAFPRISDWTCGGGRLGRRIGSLAVLSFAYNDLVPRKDGMLA